MPDWGAFGQLAQNAASSLGSDEKKDDNATKAEGTTTTTTTTSWSGVGASLKQAYTDSDGGKKVDWSSASGVAKQAVGAYQESQKDGKPDDWQATAQEVGRGFMSGTKAAVAPEDKPAEAPKPEDPAAAAPSMSAEDRPAQPDQPDQQPDAPPPEKKEEDPMGMGISALKGAVPKEAEGLVGSLLGGGVSYTFILSTCGPLAPDAAANMTVRENQLANESAGRR